MLGGCTLTRSPTVALITSSSDTGAQETPKITLARKPLCRTRIRDIAPGAAKRHPMHEVVAVESGRKLTRGWGKGRDRDTSPFGHIPGVL